MTSNVNSDYRNIQSTALTEMIAALGSASDSQKTTGYTTSGTIPAELKAVLYSDTPELELPAQSTKGISMADLAQMGKAAIMSLIDNEQRDEAVQSGLSSIETRREQRAAANEELIANLQEQAEKAEDLASMSVWQKILSVLSMVFTAIAAVATIVAGVVTGNPLLIAGGVMLTLTATEQIMSAASDGKYSLQGLGAYIIEKHGGNETANTIACAAISFLFGLTGAALSLGGSVTSTIAQTASTAQKIVNIGSSIANMTGSLANAGSAAVGIVSSVYNSQLKEIQADAADLQAILEKIQAASDLENEWLEEILERYQDMTESVSDIVDECNEALGAVLTGAPAMA